VPVEDRVNLFDLARLEVPNQVARQLLGLPWEEKRLGLARAARRGLRRRCGIFRDDPSTANWWIMMESTATPNKPSGARFRNDRPSCLRMEDAVLARDDFDFGERDALTECFCTE
jgi:hypothetical protein